MAVQFQVNNERNGYNFRVWSTETWSTLSKYASMGLWVSKKDELTLEFGSQ